MKRIKIRRLLLPALVFSLGVHALAIAAPDPAKLVELTVEQAEVLVAKKGRLSLPGLTWLSAESAAVLARHEGELELNGLTELSGAAAAGLSKHAAVPGFARSDLYLNGIRHLSVQAAEALAAHKGCVSLHGLESLDSLPLATKIAAQWGEVRLGVSTLAPEVAAELARSRGVSEDRSRPGVVIRRGDKAASILRFDRLTSLGKEVAQALAGADGVLVLNGLEKLEANAAEQLALHKGTLVLNGIKELSVETAAALAVFPGELVLKALPRLPPGGAAALARHKGRLYLTGLASLTDADRQILEKHPNLVLPRESGFSK